MITFTWPAQVPVLGEHWAVVMQGSVPEAELAGLEGKGFPQHNANPAWKMSHTA